MPLFFLHSIQTSSSFPTFILSIKRSSDQSPKPKLTHSQIPARDRVIDFGKHKGKMLGSLPSKYLKWVSKNLRARDFHHWAILADQVLQDPVYKDRLEWELAQEILNGDHHHHRTSRTQSPVSDLLDIAQRFGWDNDDKPAWNRIDFALLGTSKGGRIPRIRASSADGDDEKLGFYTLGEDLGGKHGVLNSKTRVSSKRGSGLKKGGNLGSLGAFEEDLRVQGVKETAFSSSSARRGFEKLNDYEDDLGSLGPTSRVFEEDLRVQRAEDAVFSTSGVRRGFKESKNYEDLGNLVSSDGYKGNFGSRKVGFLREGRRYYCDTNEEGFGGESGSRVRERREERRERQRMKREVQMEKLKREVIGVKEEESDDHDHHHHHHHQVFMNNNNNNVRQSRKPIFNPFPGREALLRKVSQQKRPF